MRHIDDGLGILKDGEHILIPHPHYLLDGSDDVQDAIRTERAIFDRHRPGFRVADQKALDASAAAYEERTARTSAAWRSQDRIAADTEVIAAASVPSKDDPRAAALRARDEYLRNAWRSA